MAIEGGGSVPADERDRDGQGGAGPGAGDGTDQAADDRVGGLPHPEQSACPRCGVPGSKPHADVMGCADAQIAYYAEEVGRCSCGAPERCTAPRFGGQHVPPEVWLQWEGRRS